MEGGREARRAKKHSLEENFKLRALDSPPGSLSSSTGFNHLNSGVAPLPSNLSISSEEII